MGLYCFSEAHRGIFQMPVAEDRVCDHFGFKTIWLVAGGRFGPLTSTLYFRVECLNFPADIFNILAKL